MLFINIYVYIVDVGTIQNWRIRTYVQLQVIAYVYLLVCVSYVI